MKKLDLSSRAKKFLEALPPKQFRQIANKIFSLLENPDPPDSSALQSSKWRRTDIGEYRIIYRLEGDVVKVPLIGKRNDAEVYRDLERLR